MIIEFKDRTFMRITDEQYEKIRSLLAQDNAPRFLEVNGELYETYKIRAIVSDETGKSYIKQAEYEKQRAGGGWRCNWGNWHPRQYNDCSCSSPRWREHNRGKHAEVPVFDARPLLERGREAISIEAGEIKQHVSRYGKELSQSFGMPGQKEALAQRDSLPGRTCKGCDVMILKGIYCPDCKPLYA